MGVGPTYSFKDLVGSISNPIVGQTILLGGGNVGFGSITLSMSTERTAHDVAGDGTVMPSYIAGDNATLAIEVQQTSLLHKQLLALYNAVAQLANADDITAWAATRCWASLVWASVLFQRASRPVCVLVSCWTSPKPPSGVKLAQPPSPSAEAIRTAQADRLGFSLGFDL